jgi:hypothetical protein
MIGECLAIPDLAGSDRDAMFSLLDRHFLAMDRGVFESDLRGKDGAVVLREAGAVVGFSTFTLRASVDGEGRAASVLCSGDTLIDPGHWGSSALGRTLIQSAWDLHRRSGRETFWWLLITSGPRTWGVLPTFFKEFHPHPSLPEPSGMVEWMRTLCEERWPARRDPATGVIRLIHPQRLRPPLDVVPASRAGDAAVRWFVSANPGWRSGDELPSLVRIDPANLTRAGWRYLSEYLEAHP